MRSFLFIVSLSPMLMAGGGAAASNSELAILFFLLVLIVGLPIAVPIMLKYLKRNLKELHPRHPKHHDTA